MNTNSSQKLVWQNWLWLIPTLVGAILVFSIMIFMPPDRKLYGIVDFLFKLSPLIFVVFAISLFPNKQSWPIWLLVGSTLFYMGFVDSQSVIQVNKLLDAAEIGMLKQQFHNYYRFNLFVNSFTFLFALFAFRLGGGKWDQVLKLGIFGILIIISGLNDITAWFMDNDPAKTDVFYWAYHVKIFIGRDPRLNDMLVFLAVHLILGIGFMLLPLRKWGGKTQFLNTV